MKRYSLGFIFDKDFNYVLLIHKIKPDWQKGKINGIGGKIEENESPLSCIVREIKEETDLVIQENACLYIANLSSSEFFTEVYTCVYSGNKHDARSLEIEKIEWFSIDDLPKNMMNNLSWLIPLSIDKLKHNEPSNVKVIY